MECYLVKEVTMNKDRTQGSNVKYEVTDFNGIVAKGYDPAMPYQQVAARCLTPGANS